MATDSVQEQRKIMIDKKRRKQKVSLIEMFE